MVTPFAPLGLAEASTAELFAGGDPVMSTAANAIDAIAYFANAANEIEASIIKGLS